jgi:hypothetical protein
MVKRESFIVYVKELGFCKMKIALELEAGSEVK